MTGVSVAAADEFDDEFDDVLTAAQVRRHQRFGRWMWPGWCADVLTCVFVLHVCRINGRLRTRALGARR
eukprot:COSAG02_NODE_218_length_28570_cov_75.594816_17_plen_69_part_00